MAAQHMPKQNPLRNTCRLQRVACSLALTVTLSLAGCMGSDRPLSASVAGSVTMDGQPIQKGLIVFLPTGTATGPSVTAEIVNGIYELPPDKGPMIGTNRVEITAHRPTGKKIPAGPPGPPDAMIDEIEAIVPAKYNVQSTLSVEINPYKNDGLNFDLTS